MACAAAGMGTGIAMLLKRPPLAHAGWWITRDFAMHRALLPFATCMVIDRRSWLGIGLEGAAGVTIRYFISCVIIALLIMN